MPTWIAVRQEIERRGGDFDGVRREYIRAVEGITNRPLVIYATAFLEDKAAGVGTGLSIDNNDLVAFDEVTHGIQGDALDVLLHSPGGFPEAAETIVSLLRARFSRLRFIVPRMAKSAATMICCAGDAILMDERSELGPIDPQLLIRRGNDSMSAPAQAILRQFDKAKESLAADPNAVAAWLPLLQPLAPSLLTECEAANQLAQNLVINWLEQYMLAANPNRTQMARAIAEYLADSRTHLSHARRIGIEQLLPLGVVVEDLRGDPRLRDAVWNLFHAITWTLQGTLAYKLIENGHGGAYIRQILVERVNLPEQLPPVIPAQPGEPQRQAPQGQRNNRRRNRR